MTKLFTGVTKAGLDCLPDTPGQCAKRKPWSWKHAKAIRGNTGREARGYLSDIGLESGQDAQYQLLTGLGSRQKAPEGRELHPNPPPENQSKILSHQLCCLSIYTTRSFCFYTFFFPRRLLCNEGILSAASAACELPQTKIRDPNHGSAHKMS